MSASSSSADPPIMRIRYRFGMAPDHVITRDPSLKEVIKEMDKIDGMVFLATVLIPSIYGYRTQSMRWDINQLYYLLLFFRFLFQFILQIRLGNRLTSWCRLQLLSELGSINWNFNSNTESSFK